MIQCIITQEVKSHLISTGSILQQRILKKSALLYLALRLSVFKRKRNAKLQQRVVAGRYEVHDRLVLTPDLIHMLTFINYL
jgi:hypothetical protein